MIKEIDELRYHFEKGLVYLPEQDETVDKINEIVQTVNKIIDVINKEEDEDLTKEVAYVCSMCEKEVFYDKFGNANINTINGGLGDKIIVDNICDECANFIGTSCVDLQK